MRLDKRSGRLRETVTESNPRRSLTYLIGAFLPRFLRRIILICLVHRSYLVHLRILLDMRTRLSQDGFQRRGRG